jgi:tetratricopeptide (TPR) repeat protein
VAESDSPEPSAKPTPDLFLSYAREDRDAAQRLAHALGEEGFGVWWDREIRGGRDFTDEIAANLRAARRVLVLWSPAAVNSSFVRDESARARDVHKLLPLRIAEVELPLGFGQIQTLDLIDWDGERDAPAFRAIVDEIHHAFGQQPTPVPVKPWWRVSWRKWAMPAIGAVVVAALGYGGLYWQNQTRAETFFQDGVAAQFATEPNLESARNNYLSALELRPRHARTHYYLGHVYAQLKLLDAARADFEAAVKLARGLDASQIADARKQLAALVVNEPAAIMRTAAVPPPVTAPAREQEPARATGPGGKPTRPSPSLQTSPSVIVGAAGPAVTSQLETLGGLPHVSASRDVIARIEPLVGQMFGPDKQERISATTSLIVDTELTSDAAPLAVKKAVSLQENMPRDATERATAESAVINTLVLLRSASPVTLRKYADDIRKLIQLARPNGAQTAAIADEVETRLKAALPLRPVAWIQIANDAQRPLAEALKRRLTASGYDVPGIENVGDKAPARSEIRTQGNSEQGLTRWQARAMDNMGLGEPKLTVLRKASPKVDSYEIWFERELCATRVVPGCGPVTPRPRQAA